MPKSSMKTVLNKLTFGELHALRILGSNVDPLIFKDFFENLAIKLRKRKTTNSVLIYRAAVSIQTRIETW